MSDTINLKRTMFGVSKKDITQYIDKVSKDVEDKLLSKDREISSLKSANKALYDETVSLKAKLKEMEDEKEKISDAFVKAEMSSRKIISDAKKEAESLLAITKEDIDNQLLQLKREKDAKTSEMNIEISKQQEILAAYKNEIKLLRESLHSVIPKIDDILKKYTD